MSSARWAEPAELGLPSGLVQELMTWHDRWQAAAVRGANRPDGAGLEAIDEELGALERERLTLAHAVQNEVGEAVVVLLDGVPVREHRGR